MTAKRMTQKPNRKDAKAQSKLRPKGKSRRLQGGKMTTELREANDAD